MNVAKQRIYKIDQKPDSDNVYSTMIIITGANGFIGSALVWAINQHPEFNSEKIIAIDSIDLHQRNLLKNSKYAAFLTKDSIWSELEKNKTEINWVLHMGACSSTTETNWNFLKENNVEYTNKLFQWCTNNNKKFIYASSAATYGNGENGFDDQTSPLQLKPLNLYGQSKLDSDKWILEQSSTPKFWYGLKFFNVFGPNEYEKGSMASIAFKAYHQIRKTNRFGLFKSYHPDYKDGEQKRDFIYVKQVTEWIVELMQKNPTSGIYNMGTGTSRTWLDLASNLFQAMNKPMQIDWLEMPENLKNQYQYFTEANMNKWQKMGLSRPHWTLEKSIQDYVQNYLDHENKLL